MKAIKGIFSLHEDLVIEILLRLPVKSLSRFKTVCQRWHSMIKSPSFVRSHFRQERNNTELLVYWEGVRIIREDGEVEKEVEDVYAISVFPDETLENYASEDHRELFEPVLGMQGPCNGIFCVELMGNILSLWNPATRMLRAVPTCPLYPSADVCMYGFGSDSLTDDIKIVLFSLNFGIRYKKPQFAIYSLTDNSWRLFVEEALFDPDAYLLPKYFHSAFPNGFCYWIKCKSQTSLDFVILAFDMHNEVFQEIEMPKITLQRCEIFVRHMPIFFEPSVAEEINIFKRYLKLKLQWYDDSLALITYRYGERCFDMWLMKEQGCWTKISTVSLVSPVSVSFELEPLAAFGIWKRNNVFAVTHDRELMIHDIDSRRTRNIEFRKVENDIVCNRVIAYPYKESLVPL